MTRKLLPLAALLVAVPALAADFDRTSLANWHHWRGPNADGTAPNADPPIEWDATTQEHQVEGRAARQGQRHADRLGRPGVRR